MSWVPSKAKLRLQLAQRPGWPPRCGRLGPSLQPSLGACCSWGCTEPAPGPPPALGTGVPPDPAPCLRLSGAALAEEASCSGVSAPTPAPRRGSDCLRGLGLLARRRPPLAPPAPPAPAEYPSLQPWVPRTAWPGLSPGIALFNQDQCPVFPDKHVGAPRCEPRRGHSVSAGCKAHAEPWRLPLNRGLAAVPRPVSALRQDVLRPEQSGFVRNRSACDSRRRLLSTRRGVTRQARERPARR